MPTRRHALAAGVLAAVPRLAPAIDTAVRLSTFSVDVTPPIGHPCMGGGIAPVKEVLDPLFAHGLVLTGAGKPVVVLAVDWCEIRNGAYDRWRKLVADAVGTEPVRVLVNALHQHDAPIADLEGQLLLDRHGNGAAICDLAFHEKTVQRVAVAAKECLAKSRPVTHVGTGQAKVEQVASNRRYLSPDGKPHFDRGSATKDASLREKDVGTIDPFLKALSLWDGDALLASINAYATHPMSYYGRGGVTADFVGLARKRRQTDAPGGLHLYASGCSGNVTAGKFNDGATTNRPVLADRIYRAMTAAAATTKHPLREMAFRSVPLTLEPRGGKGFTDADLTARLTGDARPFGRCLAALGLSWRRRCDAGRAIDLPVIDFGAAQYALLPAESYVEYQLTAQAARPDSFVVVAGYGESGPGYIPTEQAWAENDTNLSDWCWVAPGSEAKMRAAIAAALWR